MTLSRHSTLDYTVGILRRKETEVITRESGAYGTVHGQDIRINGKPSEIEIGMEILDRLPHGSGINGVWTINARGGNFVCSNTYDAMNDAGMYCHYYDFSVTVSPEFEMLKFNFHGNRERACCGIGLRDYLENYIMECLALR